MKNVFLLSCFLVSISAFSQKKRATIDAQLNALKTAKEDTNKVRLLNQMINFYWDEDKNESKDTIGLFSSLSIRLARKLAYQDGLAEALYHFGKYNLSITRLFAIATPSLLESLSLFEQKHDSANISKCYLQLGLISLTMQYYEDAIKKMQLSIGFKPNLTSKYLLAICYSELNNITYAKRYFKEAILDCQQTGNIERLIECHIYLGKMYVEANNLDSGFYYLKLAVKEIQLTGSRDHSLGRPYAFISKAYLKNNEIEKAIYYAEMGFQMGKKWFDQITISDAASTLTDAYAILGNYRKAYFYLHELTSLKDSVFQGSAKQKVAEMQSNFDSEKKINEQKITREKDKEIAQQQIQKEKILRNSFVVGTFLSMLFLVVLWNRFNLKRSANLALEEKNTIISQEKERSDHLLLNILPSGVAEELKQKGQAVAKQFENVTVLFTDFVNFTGISEQMTPTELVQELHRFFTAFDAIIESNGLEKIKTIGDAYLAVSGLPNETWNHAQRVTQAAIEIADFIATHGGKFQIRIGIHSGPVVAGIVGVKKYAYDIWGDTVNTAARMEQKSEAGKINISGATYALIKNDFSCIHRGKISAKNKGEIDMYFVC